MSFDILENDNEIQRRIYGAIAKDFTKIVNKHKLKIQKDLKAQIPGWILSQPEAISLSSDGMQGSLNAQFGLLPGQGIAAMQQIADAVAASIIIKFSTISPQNLSGGISFLIQPTHFQNLLSLTSGFTLATSLADPSSYGGELHWLDWLLMQGDKIIVTGYSYIPENAGRSGGGTMRLGGSFRVDPSYSGTADNNFITRAFKNKESQISRIISKYFLG